MKIKFKCLICGLIGLISTVLLNASQPTPNEISAIQTVSSVIKTTRKMAQTDRIWPGYDLSKLPIVIWFDTGHIFAINLKSDNPIWQKTELSDEASFITFAEKDKWGVTKVPMHPDFNVDGQKVFVFKMSLNTNPQFLPFLILTHERFHLFQFSAFDMSEETKEGYLDHFNYDNLALMQMEDMILMDYVSEQNPEIKLEKLKNFQAIHHERESIMQPSSIKWEDHQQRMEGLAEYVAIKALREANAAPRFHTQLYLYYALKGELENDLLCKAVIKQRHYGVGAILGTALDFLKAPQWKENVQKGTALDELLAKQLNMSSEDIHARLISLKAAYNFGHIRENIAKNTGAYKDEIDQLMQQHSEQEGIAMVVFSPPDSSIIGGGNNKELYFLADGSTLAVEDTSTATSDDQQWRLEVKHMPQLINNKEGGREFKVEPNLELMLDGKPVLVSDLVELRQKHPFKQIEWHGNKSNFSSQNHPGHIEVIDGKANVIYEG